jgi:hypothetical protein
MLISIFNIYRQFTVRSVAEVAGAKDGGRVATGDSRGRGREYLKKKKKKKKQTAKTKKKMKEKWRDGVDGSKGDRGTRSLESKECIRYIN